MLENKITKTRVVVVFLLLITTLFLLSGRLAWIQFVQGGDLQAQAIENRIRQVPVEPKRGTIYDRNMRELAVSVSTDFIYAIPPQVNRSEQAETIAEVLSGILEMPYETVYQRITREGSWFEYIARKVDAEKALAVKAHDFPGVHVDEENQRFYPNDHLAAHILGFAGIDNQGLEGLERSYEALLRGEKGSIVIEFDGAGRQIPHAVHDYDPPVEGKNLVLTIDETIQFIAERELDLLMESASSPAGATIVAMDPKTGEVLALANRPTYDPNRFSSYPQDTWRNAAVVNNYEPGSTFKIITAATYLEEALIMENETFVCEGSVKVGAERIRCWRSHDPHGEQTFAEGVHNSCNPVFIELGLRLEEKEKGLLYGYLRDFGFGRATGIDLPGEARGILLAQKDLRPVNIATISMGQGIAVTPLQMVTAVSAIANGGYLMTPYVVKEVREPSGEVIVTTESEIKRQVLSKETAEEVLHILEEVVSLGTGRNAYIEGYRVGGKTGTAQKAGPGGYLPGKFVSSFLGIAPIDDPRLVVLVIVDEPKGYPHYGGTLAAPIFKRLVEESLHYLGVPPQYSTQSALKNMEENLLVVPNLEGLTVDNAERAISSLGLLADFRGTGSIVASQHPEASAKISPGTRVTLQLKEGEATGEVMVPDIRGYRVYQAANLLEAMGLKLSPTGSGYAIEQDPLPNESVRTGTEIRVLFEEMGLME